MIFPIRKKRDIYDKKRDILLCEVSLWRGIQVDEHVQRKFLLSWDSSHQKFLTYSFTHGSSCFFSLFLLSSDEKYLIKYEDNVNLRAEKYLRENFNEI